MYSAIERLKSKEICAALHKVLYKGGATSAGSAPPPQTHPAARLFGRRRKEPMSAGLPRWWSQDQAVLHQPEVKAKSYNAGAGRAEPIDSSVPSNWWRRESGMRPQQLVATAAMLQTTEPPTPNVPTVVATPGLPMWYRRQSSALLDINAATKTDAPTHVTPTLPSQNGATESTAPALSPVKRLKEWQKFAKDSLSDFSCVAPRSNKSYGCLQSRRAIVPSSAS